MCKVDSKLPFGAMLLGVGVVLVGSLLARPASPGSPVGGPPLAVSPEPTGRTAVVVAATPSAAAELNAEVPLDPAVAPQEPSGECTMNTGIIDRIPTPIETAAAMSSAVVQGRIEAIGKAQWNTVGGKLPDGEHITGLDVMRLISVRVDTVLRGEPTTTTFWISGGSIGCHLFSVTGHELEEGQEYVFFLANFDPASGIRGTMRVRQAWSVTDGKVTTPSDGDLPAQVLAERISDRSPGRRIGGPFARPR